MRDLLDQIGVQGNLGQGLALGLLYRRLKKLAEQGEIPDLPILRNERTFKRFAVWAMNNPDAAMAQLGLTEFLNRNGVMLQQATTSPPSTMYVKGISPGETDITLEYSINPQCVVCVSARHAGGNARTFQRPITNHRKCNCRS